MISKSTLKVFEWEAKEVIIEWLLCIEVTIQSLFQGKVYKVSNRIMALCTQCTDVRKNVAFVNSKSDLTKILKKKIPDELFSHRAMSNREKSSVRKHYDKMSYNFELRAEKAESS